MEYHIRLAQQYKNKKTFQVLKTSLDLSFYIMLLERLYDIMIVIFTDRDLEESAKSKPAHQITLEDFKTMYDFVNIHNLIQLAEVVKIEKDNRIYVMKDRFGRLGYVDETPS